MHDVLGLFHPLIGRWFAEEVGVPTSVQAQAWPEIARGSHVLLTAPTGSGKTLAAFLWALHALVSGVWPAGRTSVVYISPLKALNNDVERNLLAPLAALRERFRAAGESFPDLEIHTRSGDTPQEERRRALRRHPEILITTPESLNILLSSISGRSLLGHVQTVILDEVHALVSAKRGTHTITAVERLTLMAGEFQRVALSATVTPLEVVAEFVGGYTRQGEGEAARYEGRAVKLIAPKSTKPLTIEVRFPSQMRGEASGAEWWQLLAEQFVDLIEAGRSTLLFTNSRRVCERVAMLVNEAAGQLVAYSHHGSLSREVRTLVEQRLKDGALRAIVATHSLELGIDVGALDRVILVETPPSVTSAIQRIGRAGHRVAAASHGVLFPTHARDLVDAAVLARAVNERAIEPVHPVRCPLDVLAQVIVSMAATQAWPTDALYAFLRTTWPYRTLAREAFDRVVDMLAGRYEEARIRALDPVLRYDRLANVIQAKPASARLVFQSGGTIPDRGYYAMRRADSKAKIGELDEEFVWERRLGDTFAMGTQTWRIDRITHSDVFVMPTGTRHFTTPFWRADQRDRGFLLAERTALFLEEADGRLDDPRFVAELQARYALTESAAGALLDFLQRQHLATGVPLPHRRHVLVERCAELVQCSESAQLILHTMWGGALNRPFAVALAQAWEERFNTPLESYASNDCVALVTQEEVDPNAIFSLVTPENLAALLRRGLERTGYFGARFRECAGIALQLPRAGFDKRTPLWMTRLRSKRLLDAVMRHEDFPILAEAWRTCLEDEFDLPNLKRMLDEIEHGAIRIGHVRTPAPSPFAESLVWGQTNLYMYTDDTPAQARASSLSDAVLAEAVHTAALRPKIPPALVRRFVEKRQRLWPGYAPGGAEELLDWLKERLFIPREEWRALLDAMERDHGIAVDLATLEGRVVRVECALGSGAMALESVRRFREALGIGQAELRLLALASDESLPTPGTILGDEEEAPLAEAERLAGWLGEWLRAYGPIEIRAIHERLPVGEALLEEALNALADDREVVVDLLTAGAQTLEVCDAENLETLLRWMRAEARPDFQARPLEELPLFLATWQGLVASPREAERLEAALEPLLAYAMPAALLEAELIPARVHDYRPEDLDTLMQRSELMWQGCGQERIALAFPEQLELLPAPDPQEASEAVKLLDALFPHEAGRFTFSDLLAHTGLPSRELAERLWKLAWQGRVTNDAMAALRRGVETRFCASDQAGLATKGGRRGFARWRATRPFAGAWRVVPELRQAADAIEHEERNKERVRQLLGRYGVLFRELLEREAAPFRWGALFRTLRLMELAGEVVAGSFFEGIPGPQFASNSALHVLRKGLDTEACYWMNALDPASPCGLGLAAWRGATPARVPSTHLAYEGIHLAMISMRQGKSVEFRIPPDHPRLPEHLAVFETMLTRRVRPASSIALESINGEPAARSAYLPAFRARFDVDVSPGGVTLWRNTGARA